MKAKLHLKSRAERLNASVSRLSLWYDKQWIFDNPTAGQKEFRSTIQWEVRLPDGSCLIDDQWADLLESFRCLVWSLYTSARNGVQYKPGMASDFSRQIAYFARWMVYNGYHSFSELDSIAFDEYVESVYEDKASDPDNPPTATQLLKFLKLPPLMWLQSPELKLAGIVPIQDEPYGGSSAFSLAKQLAEDIRGQISPIEDGDFINIMMAALLVIEDIDEIAAAVDIYMETFDGSEAKAAVDPQRQMNAFWTKVGIQHPRALPYFQANVIMPLIGAVAIAREAGSIVVQGGVGLRGAEVCGLVGNLDQNGLPACVTMRPSVSGLDEIFFIKGRVYKGESGWAEHEWVAGARPVGTSHLPPPIRAALALERLFRRFRTSQNEQRLLLYTDRPQGRFSHEYGFKPITSEHLRRSQGAFIKDHVGLAELKVTPSQWRKTFAQFVVRTDSRTPPALRDHFRHVSLASTEIGYARADPQYRQVMEDAAVQNSFQFLGSLVSGRKAAVGPMVEIVRESAARMGGRLGNRSVEERRSDIEEMVLESDIRVYELRFDGQSAGDCLYRPGVGRCTEGCIARWVMKAPLWSAARPDMCWECQNMVVSPEHGEFWQLRWSRHRSVCESATLSGDAGLENLARVRMAQCASVLSRLGLDIPGRSENC